MKNLFSVTVALLMVIGMVTSCDEENYIDPVLNTLPPVDADITATTAKLKGSVQLVGNRKIVMYGIEIYKNSLANPLGVQGFDTIPELGEFEVQFTNLEPSTHYYYKAFAQINTAYVYSQNAEDFNTKAASK